ncbi:MAG: O-antigen ligase family protein [Cyanobacteria bacterium J06634_5]
MELTDGAPSLPKQETLSIVWQGQWIGVVGLACILAFSWIPGSYYSMVGWPWVILWQVAFLLLGAWHIWAIRQFSVPFRRLGYGFDWIVGMALLVNILSALNADFKVVALWNVLLLGHYTLTFYLLVNWLRQGLTKMFLWFALSLAGIVTSIIGLSFWRPTSDMWLSNNFYAALRNPWPLGHHNFVGGYELLLLPITVSFGLSQQGWKKWVSLGASVIVAIALYVSGSRGAVVGVLAIFFVGAPTLIWIHRAQASRRWLICSAMGLAIVLTIAASNPRMRSLFSTTTFSQVGQISPAAVTDGPAQDRLFMLQAARNILATHPLTGVGPGNLSRVYNLYRPIEVGTGLELVQQLHNTPAQILAELGLFGLAVYGSWLIGLLGLSIKICNKVSKPSDRYLLYGICACYLGYGVSSLTDYQLENIGISSTLLIITALLINLGDTYVQTPSIAALRPAKLSRQSRRWLSMVFLAFLCMSLQLWARVNAGLYLSNAAFKDIDIRSSLVDADRKWSKANDLAPWDPTYPALAAAQLTGLKSIVESEADQAALNASAIEHLEAALNAAPNDALFNQNMSVLLMDIPRPKKAQVYAERAAMLSPRNPHYTYYTLGISYLQQNKTEQAITAFSIEGMAKPDFLTADIWADETFSLLLPSVLDQTLKYYRNILSQTNPTSPGYAWMNEQLVMLSWWHQRSIEGIDTSKLQPLVQAILKAESEPEMALKIVEKQIQIKPHHAGLQLLRAWLSPDKYLSSYLKDFEGTQQEQDLLEKHITLRRDLHTWMSSVLQVNPAQFRNGVSFAYRNFSADNIQQILHPGELRTSLFSQMLGLWRSAPRTFPQLDQEISEIKATNLSLQPLKETRFRLPE